MYWDPLEDVDVVQAAVAWAGERQTDSRPVSEVVWTGLVS